MSGRGNNNKTAQSLYIQQTLGTKKSDIPADQRDKVDKISAVFDWPEEDILRVLQDCGYDTDLAIQRIADSNISPSQWEEVGTKQKSKSDRSKQKNYAGSRDGQGQRRTGGDNRQTDRRQGGSPSQGRNGGNKKGGNKDNTTQGGQRRDNATSGAESPSTTNAAVKTQDQTSQVTKAVGSMNIQNQPTTTPVTTTTQQPSLAPQPVGQSTTKPVSYLSKLQQQTTPPPQPVVAQQPQKPAQAPVSESSSSAGNAGKLPQSDTSANSPTQSRLNQQAQQQQNKQTWKPKDGKDAQSVSPRSTSPTPSSSHTASLSQPQQPPTTHIDQHVTQQPAIQAQPTQTHAVSQTSTTTPAQTSTPARTPAFNQAGSSPVVLPAASRHLVDHNTYEFFGSHDFGLPKATTTVAVVELPKSKAAVAPTSAFSQQSQHQTPQHGVPSLPTPPQHPQLHSTSYEQPQIIDYQSQQSQDGQQMLEQDPQGHHPSIPPYSYLPHGAPHMSPHFGLVPPFVQPFGYDADSALRAPPMNLYDPSGYPGSGPYGQHHNQSQSQESKFNAPVRTGSGSSTSEHKQFGQYGSSNEVTSPTTTPNQSGPQNQNQQRTQQQQQQFAPYAQPMYYNPYSFNMPHYQIPKTSQYQAYPGFYPGPNFATYPNPTGTSSNGAYGSADDSDYSKHVTQMGGFPMHSTPFYAFPPEQAQPAQTQGQQQGQHGKTPQQNNNNSKASQSFSPPPSGPQSGTNSMYSTATRENTTSFYNSVPGYGNQNPSSYPGSYPHHQSSGPYSGSSQRNQQNFQ